MREDLSSILHKVVWSAAGCLQVTYCLLRVVAKNSKALRMRPDDCFLCTVGMMCRCGAMIIAIDQCKHALLCSFRLAHTIRRGPFRWLALSADGRVLPIRLHDSRGRVQGDGIDAVRGARRTAMLSLLGRACPQGCIPGIFHVPPGRRCEKVGVQLCTTVYGTTQYASKRWLNCRWYLYADVVFFLRARGGILDRLSCAGLLFFARLLDTCVSPVSGSKFCCT